MSKKENYILEVNHLKKSYQDLKVLEDINFHMKKGKILGLLGRNGAGKTTLMKCILGLNVQYEGEIMLDGEKIHSEHPALKKQVGSLVDIKFFEDLTAYDNLKLVLMITDGFPKEKINARIDEVLEMVDLMRVKKKKVKQFSFGMKQRLALAQAMLTEPKLLILDEPFVGLDPIGIDDMKGLFRKFCKEQQTSIIFSSHQLDEVEDLAEDIIVLSSGKIKFEESYSYIKANEISLLDLMR